MWNDYIENVLAKYNPVPIPTPELEANRPTMLQAAELHKQYMTEVRLKGMTVEDIPTISECFTQLQEIWEEEYMKYKRKLLKEFLTTTRKMIPDIFICGIAGPKNSGKTTYIYRHFGVGPEPNLKKIDTKHEIFYTLPGVSNFLVVDSAGFDEARIDNVICDFFPDYFDVLIVLAATGGSEVAKKLYSLIHDIRIPYMFCFNRVCQVVNNNIELIDITNRLIKANAVKDTQKEKDLRVQWDNKIEKCSENLISNISKTIDRFQLDRQHIYISNFRSELSPSYIPHLTEKSVPFVSGLDTLNWISTNIKPTSTRLEFEKFIQSQKDRMDEDSDYD